MAEYIEKQAALDAILREPPDAHYPSWYAERIKALPAADVAPVVRCKDCENAQNECGGMIICRVYKHVMWLQAAQPGSVVCMINRLKYGGSHADELRTRQVGRYCQFCGQPLKEIGEKRFCNNVQCWNRYTDV